MSMSGNAPRWQPAPCDATRDRPQPWLSQTVTMLHGCLIAVRHHLQVVVLHRLLKFCHIGGRQTSPDATQISKIQNRRMVYLTLSNQPVQWQPRDRMSSETAGMRSRRPPMRARLTAWAGAGVSRHPTGGAMSDVPTVHHRWQNGCVNLSPHPALPPMSRLALTGATHRLPSICMAPFLENMRWQHSPEAKTLTPAAIPAFGLFPTLTPTLTMP